MGENNNNRIRPEDLEDGILLKDMVKRFNADRTELNLFNVFQVMRDSFVWVPCNSILSETDSRNMHKLLEEHIDNIEELADEKYTTADQIRLIPDILINGDKYYFPIFSSTEEMGEYGENFSKVQKHFLEVLPLARNNEKNVAGIVLNAFGEPFILVRELFDAVERIKSMFEG